MKPFFKWNQELKFWMSYRCREDAFFDQIPVLHRESLRICYLAHVAYVNEGLFASIKIQD